MSFTSDIYCDILNDLKRSKTPPSTSRVSRKQTLVNGIAAVFAINTATLMRELYVEISAKPNKTNFPKWKGIEIEIAQLPEYSDEQTFYIALMQFPRSESYIFEFIVEDVRSTLAALKSAETVLVCIENVLIKWKKFFLMDREIIMTLERQQGLFGELLFMREIIRHWGCGAIAHWTGSENETHDFYIASNAVEVKTTATQAPYNIHISSEYQLDDNDISGDLFLRFYALRKSESDGKCLPKLVEEIADLLRDNQSHLNTFMTKLQKYGYLREVQEFYTIGYFVREDSTYRVKEGFPRIIRTDLKPGVTDLGYAVNINLCHLFKIEKEELYLHLEGMKQGAE